MPAIFSWRIAGLQCFPEHEGHSMVVTNIYWTITATMDDKTTYANGNCVVRYNPDGVFVDYSSLTEPEVQSWISAEFRENVENQITARLEASNTSDILPETVSPPLPWPN